ncbi:MAG: ATP-binding protein [Bacteroidia bacterium]|nr:ATP-binding protein [Bacteroidia bacterium]
MKIEIKSSIDELSIVENFVDDLNAKLDLSDEIYGNIMIAVTEAVNNSIVHGNANDINKKIQIEVFQKNPNIVSFRIQDEGPGFDVQKVKDPTLPENIESIGGRGIFVMKHLSNEMIFNDPGNSIELRFLI